MSENPNAIHLLEQNKDKINWDKLSENPNAIHLLEQNKDKINWWYLSKKTDLSKRNKIIWTNLSRNPNIFEIDKSQTKIIITQTANIIDKLIL